MKTLVVVSHPNYKDSIINKRFVNELNKYKEKYTVHIIDQEYKDAVIDIKKEQKLIESHDNLILQFPFYFVNCPYLMKRWLDEVITPEWAVNEMGNGAMENRKVAIGVSIGSKKEEYGNGNLYLYTVEELLRPFESTCSYIHSDYRGFYPFYAAEYNPTKEEIDNAAKSYVEFIDSI